MIRCVAREAWFEMNGGKMAAAELTFHNQIKLRVQAQIFLGRTLISTCLANPGEVCTLIAESSGYDIFFKNGATGREIARKLNNEADNLTLSQQNGRYILT
jgi:hypothetical protein